MTKPEFIEAVMGQLTVPKPRASHRYAHIRIGNETIGEFVLRISAEAGLPPKCSDPAILGRIAREMVEMRSQTSR